MKFTKEQFINWWELGSKAESVTLPGHAHQDLMVQCIKLIAVVEAAEEVLRIADREQEAFIRLKEALKALEQE